ncbi:MAG: lysophospholipid acyltransferase family protein [Dehalococcoidales bacterium]|nr:lysophospholipid acyltransferase family protein [Dehalococcoidales bacterium]
MSCFFYVCKGILKTFFFLCTRLIVTGRENITSDRPLIVVANHITYAEPQFLGILLKGKMRFAAKEGFFRNRFMKTLMKSLGCFPVYQGVADRKTIRLMEQYIKEKFALVIFPEGTRSLKVVLLPALNGAAFIAQRTGASILPVGIYGTEKMRGVTWYFKRPVITVSFGQPFHLPSNNGKLSREEATQFIMERITDLLPVEYHGVYAEEGKS